MEKLCGEETNYVSYLLRSTSHVGNVGKIHARQLVFGLSLQD